MGLHSYMIVAEARPDLVCEPSPVRQLQRDAAACHPFDRQSGADFQVRVERRLSSSYHRRFPGRASAEISYQEFYGHRLSVEVVSQDRLRILSMGRKPQKNDSLPGSLDLLILKTLGRAPMHGYAIAQAIRSSSRDELLVEEGSLYPALQRLELNGWIDGEWGVTPKNRRARIYRMTRSGRRQLAVELERYARLTRAIGRVLEA